MSAFNLNFLQPDIAALLQKDAFSKIRYVPERYNYDDPFKDMLEFCKHYDISNVYGLTPIDLMSMERPVYHRFKKHVQEIEHKAIQEEQNKHKEITKLQQKQKQDLNKNMAIRRQPFKR